MTVRNIYESKRGILCSGNKCVICGWSKKGNDGTPLVEGAHIKPYENDISADVYRNIIALCPNHHTQFDRFAFYIDCETRKTVFLDESDEDHSIDISDSIKHVDTRFLAYRQYLFNQKNGERNEEDKEMGA